jgi:peptidoglycan/xylan/chitin deacetylase (PgdA/CDA1 family)
MTGESVGTLDAKDSYFKAAQSLGLFRIGRYLQQSSQSLLILCYHGISKADEHLWRPTLYMPRSLFRQRLQTLHDFGYQVLPLSAALEFLSTGSLRQPTAVLTFDDGWHDFYTEAWPELRAFGYPATVYQTTYYSLYQRPIFDTACSYLLWKARGRTLKDSSITGAEEEFALNSPHSIERVANLIWNRQNRLSASAEEKNYLLEKIAVRLDIDWGHILRSRLLHLMTMPEVAEISKGGIDVQLHTHRHWLPTKRESFLSEVFSNQDLIKAATGKRATHFCYPNGFYRPEAPTWLREAGILSATTCEPGLVRRRSERMLLSRAVDSCAVSPARFESWLSGIGLLIPSCKRKVLSFAGRYKAINEEACHGAVQEQPGEVAKAAVARAAAGS